MFSFIRLWVPNSGPNSYLETDTSSCDSPPVFTWVCGDNGGRYRLSPRTVQTLFAHKPFGANTAAQSLQQVLNRNFVLHGTTGAAQRDDAWAIGVDPYLLAYPAYHNPVVLNTMRRLAESSAEHHSHSGQYSGHPALPSSSVLGTLNLVELSEAWYVLRPAAVGFPSARGHPLRVPQCPFVVASWSTVRDLIRAPACPPGGPGPLPGAISPAMRSMAADSAVLSRHHVGRTMLRGTMHPMTNSPLFHTDVDHGAGGSRGVDADPLLRFGWRVLVPLEYGVKAAFGFAQQTLLRSYGDFTSKGSLTSPSSCVIFSCLHAAVTT